MITRRQQCFIDHYISTKNATESAKRAGYSDKTAYSQGSRLLKVAEISAAIDVGIKAEQDRLSITKDRVLDNLWKDAISADKASDRIAANIAVAKMNNWIKDGQPQSLTALFANVTERIKTIGVQHDVEVTVSPTNSIEGEVTNNNINAPLKNSNTDSNTTSSNELGQQSNTERS